MGYLNLRGEMAKRNVSIENIAELLGIHRNSVANKVSGKSRFSVDEAFSIQKTFFPDMEVQNLFATAEQEVG